VIFPLTGLALGAALGAVRARGRGGNGRDMAQWGAVHAIIGAVIGLFVLIAVARGG